MPDKSTALLGAFFNRFAIGFLVPVVGIGLPAWIRGMVVGALVSLPDAVITGAYAPILAVGMAGAEGM
jgi:hypothetical protein